MRRFLERLRLALPCALGGHDWVRWSPIVRACRKCDNLLVEERRP